MPPTKEDQLRSLSMGFPASMSILTMEMNQAIKSLNSLRDASKTMNTGTRYLEVASSALKNGNMRTRRFKLHLVLKSMLRSTIDQYVSTFS